MKSISDPSHPVWEFGRYTILLTAITIILYANANDFDVTEARSIGMMAAFMGGWSGIERFLKRSPEKEQEDAYDPPPVTTTLKQVRFKKAGPRKPKDID